MPDIGSPDKADCSRLLQIVVPIKCVMAGASNWTECAQIMFSTYSYWIAFSRSLQPIGSIHLHCSTSL